MAETLFLSCYVSLQLLAYGMLNLSFLIILILIITLHHVIFISVLILCRSVILAKCEFNKLSYTCLSSVA